LINYPVDRTRWSYRGQARHGRFHGFGWVKVWDYDLWNKDWRLDYEWEGEFRDGWPLDEDRN
jgi:hypothetical protein